jgi:small subunit ribosomal protein S17
METMAQSKDRSQIVTEVGVVDSVSGRQTIRVVLSNLVKEERYGKYRRRRTKLAAHDEKQEAQVGDTVEISRCRPLSKTKAWRLVRVVKRGSVA